MNKETIPSRNVNIPENQTVTFGESKNHEGKIVNNNQTDESAEETLTVPGLADPRSERTRHPPLSIPGERPVNSQSHACLFARSLDDNACEAIDQWSVERPLRLRTTKGAHYGKGVPTLASGGAVHRQTDRASLLWPFRKKPKRRGTMGTAAEG